MHKIVFAFLIGFLTMHPAFCAPLLQIDQQLWVGRTYMDSPIFSTTGNLWFEKFDPALGVLKQAFVQSSGSVHNYYRITNPTDRELIMAGYMDVYVWLGNARRRTLGPEDWTHIAPGASFIARLFVDGNHYFDVLGMSGIQGYGKFSMPFLFGNNPAFGIEAPGITDYLGAGPCYGSADQCHAMSFTLSYLYEPFSTPPVTETPEPASGLLVAFAIVGAVAMERIRRGKGSGILG